MVTCRFWLLGQFLFLGRKGWTTAVSWLSSGDSPKVSGARPVHGRRGARMWCQAGQLSCPWLWECAFLTLRPQHWTPDVLEQRCSCSPWSGPCSSWRVLVPSGKVGWVLEIKPWVPHKAELNWVSVQGIFLYFFHIYFQCLLCHSCNLPQATVNTSFAFVLWILKCTDFYHSDIN